MKAKVEMVKGEPAVVFPTGEYQVYNSMAEAERAIDRKWGRINWLPVMRRKRDRLAEAIKIIDEAFEKERRQ